MLNSVNDVEEWLRVNELTSWEVRSRDQENSFIYVTDETDPVESKFSKFKKIMDLSKGGRYIISASQKEGSKKGRYREEFSSLAAVAPQSQYPSPSVGMVPEGYVSKSEVEKMIEAMQLKMRMEQLETEVKDLKSENRELKEPTKEFMRKIAPVAPAIISGLMGKMVPGTAPAMIGFLDTPGEPSQEKQEETHEISLTDGEYDEVMGALSRWQNADPDWTKLLVKIARMAELKNPIYSQAKIMLLNM